MSPSREGYFDCRRRGGVADLARRVKLRFTGADRVRYLNGQVTADVRKLAAGQSVPACVLTAKGKLCADVFVTALAEALIVDADETLGDTLLARLQRYIIADDVEIEDISATWRLIHFLPPPTEPLARFLKDELLALGATVTPRLGRPGLDFFQPVPAASDALERLAHESATLDEPLVELLRIEAGLPRWGRELTEDTLPPEAGLDRTHIDYHKGCYIGQEVISRLKSVGHVNRQLTGFLSPSGAPLATGAQLFGPDGGARALGVLTSTVESFALEKPIALGYLKRGSPTGALLARSADATDAVVTVHEIPFLS